MKLSHVTSILALLTSASPLVSRTVEDFNRNWEFCLSDQKVRYSAIEDLEWRPVHIPHDWSIENGYTQQDTACSTGFTKGGVGWYRKSFPTPDCTPESVTWIEFDGVYNHSSVWLNGHFLGYRPNGYSSFSYDLTDYLHRDGSPNELVVKADHRYYADSRWYTGSGIYRNVRLITAHSWHVPQWGVKITTPSATIENATVQFSVKTTHPENCLESAGMRIRIQDESGTQVATWSGPIDPLSNVADLNVSITIHRPKLWSLESPHRYTAILELLKDGKSVDQITEKFGVRSISWDADTAFHLNGKPVKFKGVNLHHDAGCLGSAVPSEIWFTRIQKLKDMGCNAVRLSHNPHSPELLEACDSIGMLVIAESFDEWDIPKDKSVVFLSDNAAPEAIAKAYPSLFHQWAERDLKDLISRDFNHPSIIMWSIGNEIEWTYEYFSNSIVWEDESIENPKPYEDRPSYDMEKIRTKMEQHLDGKQDVLTKTARQLNEWVKEVDTTRWTTCGSVRPSVAYAAGYADAVDILGFNYRAVEYDLAHQHFPNSKIYGSENLVQWFEWQEVKDRDFVGGIFVWTGFAYLGEAGPWPRKGLNISIFDYTGIQTPRGHLFESMWKPEPKVFMETLPLQDSEFVFSETDGWSFTERTPAISKMKWLRRWEWFNMNPHWNYETGDTIVVQAYTNAPQAELFLNGESLGVRAVADFEFGAPKWIVPFSRGTLRVVGLENGYPVSEHVINTSGPVHQAQISTSISDTDLDGESILQVWVQLQDQDGHPVSNEQQDKTVGFSYRSTAMRLLGIDNGSEYNVQHPQAGSVKTYQGRAYAVFSIIRGKKAPELFLEVEGLDPVAVRY